MSCEQRAYLRRTGIGTIIDMLLAEVAAQKPDAPFHHIARRLVEVNVAQLRRTLGSATARTRYGRHDVSGARRVAASAAAAAAAAAADVVIPTTTVVEVPLSPPQSPPQAAVADVPRGASRRITITQLCRAQMEGAAGEGRRRMLGYKPNLGGSAGPQAKFNQRGYHSKAEQERVTVRLAAVDSQWTYHDVVTACLRDPASAKLLDRPRFAETIAEPLKLRSVGAPVDVTTLLDEVVSAELAAGGGGSGGGGVGPQAQASELLEATSRAVQILQAGKEGDEEGPGFLRSSVGVAYLLAMRTSVEVAGLAAMGGGGSGGGGGGGGDDDDDDGRTPAQRLVSSLAKLLAAQPSSETVLARVPLYRHPTVLLFVSARIGAALPGDDWRHFAREEFSLQAAAAAGGGSAAASEDAALFPPRCPLECAFVATENVFLVLWLHAWRLAVSPPTPPPPEQLEALSAFLDAAAAPAAEETLRLRRALLRADGGGQAAERARHLLASVPPAPVCGLEHVRTVRRAGAGGGLAAVCAWNAEQRARTLLCRRLATLHAAAAKGMPWGAEGGGGDAADGGRLAEAQAYWEVRAGAHAVAAPYAAVRAAVDAAAAAVAGDGGGEGALRAALRRFLDFFGNGTCVAGQLALLLVGMGDKVADGGGGGSGAGTGGFEAALQRAVTGFATVCATHTLVADSLGPPQRGGGGGGGGGGCPAAPVTLHQHTTLPDPPSFALCGGPRTRCGVVLRGGAWCADAAFPPQASLNTVVALYRGDAAPGGDRVFKTAAGAVRDVALLAAAARCRERRSDDALDAAAELVHGCRPSCGMAEVTRLCRQLLRLGGCTSERLAASLLPALLAAGGGEDDSGGDAEKDGLRVSHGALLGAAARAWAVLRPALLKDALVARHHTLLALVPPGLQDGVRLGWTLEEYLCRGGAEALAAAAEGSGGQQAYAALLAAALGVAVEEETWARAVGDPPSPPGAGSAAAEAAPKKRTSQRRRSS